MNRYEMLRYEREAPVGVNNWLGNLRWYAQEESTPLSYTYVTVPNRLEDGEYIDGIWKYMAKRILMKLSLEDGGDVSKSVYYSDRLEVETDKLSFSTFIPWFNYGSVVQIETFGKEPAPFIALRSSMLAGRNNPFGQQRSFLLKEGLVLYRDGDYTVAIRHDGLAEAADDDMVYIRLGQDRFTKLAIAFNMNEEGAVTEAETLFSDTDRQLTASRDHWERYLDSCPLVEFDDDFRYFQPFDNKEVVYKKEEIKRRQLWHWWCALVNVYDIEFNDYPVYVAGEKANWFGVWSNDGPGTISILSLTNASGLARRCLVAYIRASVDEQGNNAWYIHANGQPCFGTSGDTGRLSHGVPNFVHTVEFYVRNTKDLSILDEDGGHGYTVWEKIKLYMESVFLARDVNGDGMIEWANLWETGWDDKIGPFFSRAPLESWIQTLAKGTAEEVKSFYDSYRCPVTTISEQADMLWALDSLRYLSEIRQEKALVEQFKTRSEKILNTMRSRHWSDEERFYFDWDVRNERLSRSKNLDAFYWMYFEKDRSRLESLYQHLNDTEHFNLRHIPTLSRSSEGFDPQGYWCGGSWPREHSYVGMALHKSGYSEKALEVVLRGLCSQEGNLTTENLNPLTGENNTRIWHMPYCSLLNIALLEIAGQVCWSEYHLPKGEV